MWGTDPLENVNIKRGLILRRRTVYGWWSIVATRIADKEQQISKGKLVAAVKDKSVVIDRKKPLIALSDYLTVVSKKEGAVVKNQEQQKTKKKFKHPEVSMDLMRRWWM